MTVDEATGAEPTSGSGADRDALTDLFGLLSYAELTACLRMASDAQRVPDLDVQISMARMSSLEAAHFELLAARLTELGADPAEAMRPFVPAISAFHDRTRPRDWLEGLVKAYVGDGIARDFYREIGTRLPAEDQQLVHRVLADAGQDDFIVEVVRRARTEEPAVGGRLALWARRLVGEAIAQAQYVAVEREGLARLVVGGEGGLDLAELSRLFTRLTEAHVARMQRMGLSH
jgi:tRNA-(MS[2]IO[6]A)-hydroxylase (MiaE)-like